MQNMTNIPNLAGFSLKWEEIAYLVRNNKVLIV